MEPDLSICIITYNRALLLKECLEFLLPQVSKYLDKTEIIISNNASSDNTRDVVYDFLKTYPFIKYFENLKNLGPAGNQIECFKKASGRYINILGDDDIFTSGLLETILKVISKKEYALLFLNYYSFVKNPLKPYQSNFAPEKDVTFKRAFDILNYPSVGHNSGFVFKGQLAKKIVEEVYAPRNYQDYFFETLKTCLDETAVRIAAQTNLPSYFIGKRLLAVRITLNPHYDSLRQLVLMHYRFWKKMFQEGLLNRADFEYREKNALIILPKAVISNTPDLDKKELEEIIKEASQYFRGNKKFDWFCRPLLLASRYFVIKKVYAFMRDFSRFIKNIKIKINYD